MVSLRGVPISLPSIATVGFSEFFQLGRVLRCHLLVSGGRVVHLVGVYGFQGASTDSEKLRLTEKLLYAVICELAVVASGQPCLIVGDLNIELERIPCLLKVSWLATGLICSRLGLLLLVLIRFLLAFWFLWGSGGFYTWLSSCCFCVMVVFGSSGSLDSSSLCR